MILSYQTLLRRHAEFIGSHLDPSLINPASIDIRVGNDLIVDDAGMERKVPLLDNETYWMKPGEFVLVSTLECLKVPLDCAVELRLKSSRAREGYNHSLAFWFDPGWVGVGTMELKNYREFSRLPIRPGMKIGQLIIHKLDEVCAKPYEGRYNNAQGVEGTKL